MVTVETNNFSIEQICESGQCFRMNKVDESTYVVIAFGKYLEMRQRQDKVTFYCSRKEYETIWLDYFDLNVDYSQYIDSVVESDSYLHKTVQFGNGIRILKQDTWEIIISFIISQQNNIKRIKKSIELLCERFGEKKHYKNHTFYYTFPTVEALAAATEEELRNCNLGYRSRYVLRTANSILKNEICCRSLKKMSYMDAKYELLKLFGVGSKVADCICLFALHQLEAFPIDTHIKKVLDIQYPQGFPYENYSGYEGVVQQYIFYYDLKKGLVKTDKSIKME